MLLGLPRSFRLMFLSPASKKTWVLALAGLLAAGCRAAPNDGGEGKSVELAPGGEWFIEQAQAVGLEFVHTNGMTGRFYPPEIFGPGVALFDYDNDGDLDIFVQQGRRLGESELLSEQPMTGRLFRNDIATASSGQPELRFEDVTERVGIQAREYGMGVAAADFNNDGCVDLYLTNFGPNQLFRNNCNGTFQEVARISGVSDPSWSVSAAFFDYDRDGWLDLFVANYLDYTTDIDGACFAVTGERDYCPPTRYRPKRSRLYHNNGNGTFTDVTVKTLAGGEFGPALGVVAADFDRNGWVDIFVANDGQPDELWVNQENGTFRNDGLISGAALNISGHATASMGVDAGDFDNDGDDDLFHTNLTGEGSTLLVNNGTGLFADETRQRGLLVPSLPHTGFGTAWLDFDNDGWLDIFSVNGKVRVVEGSSRAGGPFPYQERRQLFHGLGDGRFVDVTDRAGSIVQAMNVSRGAAFGDVDNDGDTDVVIGNDNGPLELLINTIGSRNHWVGLRLVDGRYRRDMLGARVEVIRADGFSQSRRVRSDGSYASASDSRVLVGLGASTDPISVRVTWPDGREERWAQVPIDGYVTLVEGAGQ